VIEDQRHTTIKAADRDDIKPLIKFIGPCDDVNRQPLWPQAANLTHAAEHV